MAKAQHHDHYRRLPALLRQWREEAGMTQRQLGQKMDRPQSWIFNCESSNRRVDVTEFLAWCRACEIDPVKAFKRVAELVG